MPDCHAMTHSYSTFWRDIYCESIVEHDHRLRSICTQLPWINFEEIIDVDWKAARNEDNVASHPIAIYLNKLAPKSRECGRINKDVIYKRHKPVFFSVDGDTISLREISGLRVCSFATINPRLRWIKLYERNPRFTSTISALSTQLNRLIQSRSRLTEDEPAGSIPRSIASPLDEYLNCYKVRIYHRQAWNPMMEGASFPLIWKEPDPSTLVDDVSGVALYHITLLGRDMICECNKCTLGCQSVQSGQCDACRLDFTEHQTERVVPSPVYSESFAEGCMLPSFFVCNELNKPIKKMSDIDMMLVLKDLAGFGADTFATTEMENCKPGYLRLRVAENGQLLRFSENTEFQVPVPNQLRSIKQSYHKKSFSRGPAITYIPHDDREPESDEVYYLCCPSWPSIAQTWIDRERRSKWPPEEMIREIVSKGCRIVHKPHPSSRDPDAEFRFSFSVAEVTLFDALSVDQKNVSLHSKLLISNLQIGN